jgi:adenylate kinase family enzyme
MRINIVGSGGSGKTRLATALAEILDCPHFELDAFHWGPNWTEAPLDEFRTQVATLVQGERWVIDGNYGGKVRDILWPRATTVVWLDYGLGLVLWRLVRRSLGRSLTRQALWNGNRESLWGQFVAKDSLIRYTINTHQRRQAQMQWALSDPAHAHIDFVRLPSPAAADAWLTQIHAGTTE